ncbi:hypothetical protein, partial [Vibrio cincinnatiensis]
IPLYVMIVLSILAMNARLSFVREIINLTFIEFYYKVILRVSFVLLMSSLSIYFLVYSTNVAFVIAFPLSFLLASFSSLIFGLKLKEIKFLIDFIPFISKDKKQKY